MRAILSVALVCGLALGLIGAAVFGLKDTQTFIAPPESTAEGFMRAVVAGRYSRATPHLSHKASAQITEAALRELAGKIKSNTKVLDVIGAPISVGEESAQAVAIVKTTSGERRVAFWLVREKGVWVVDALEWVDRRRPN